MIKIDWLDILSKGLITSSLVFAATILWERYKIKQEIRGCALLLYGEVNDHINQLSIQDSLCIELLLNSPDIEWKESKHFLAHHLCFDDFQPIHKHYSAMKSDRTMLQKEGRIPEPFLSEHLIKANAALSALLTLSKLNKRKLNKYMKETT